MTAETIIEGEAHEVALTVIPRDELARSVTPEDTIGLATRMATVLKDIVERQQLYAIIQGKKFPQVEAWMTIGRMDNVVAREVTDGVLRHEDGSYEATVELIRLGDGMVVGRASALCGTKGDKPWDTRAEPARRSMAVTRATSRAFRLQYSWIMALAGYEPTPADEMPGQHEPPQREASGDIPLDERPAPPDPVRQDLGRPPLERRANGLVGTVAVGKRPVDLELRETPDGPAWGFKLTSGRQHYQALAIGQVAQQMFDAIEVTGSIVGQTVTVWGHVEMIPWQKDGKDMPPYARIAIERLQTDDWTLPAPDEAMPTDSRAGQREDDLSDLDF